MVVLSDISGAPYWTALAQQLLTEALACDDPVRAAALDGELFRLLADRLGKPRDAHQRIDAAAAQDQEAPDVAWESWRAAVARDSGSQAAALERLIAIVEEPRTRAACHLALSRLREHHLSEPNLAAASLASAAEADPDSRGARWSQIVAALTAGDDRTALPLLEQTSKATADPIWRAAIELEIAAIKGREQADPAAISAHLETALEQPGCGWTIAHEVMRTSAAIGNESIQERALERIADAALDPPPAELPDKPPGHSFDAYKHGPAVAAAHLYLMSRARERATGGAERAIEALDRALALHAGSEFLLHERARLLEACGRNADALAAIPEGASPTMRAELALTAGQPELAFDLARTAAGESPSVLPTTIAEVAEVIRGTTADTDIGVQDPAQWLLANPDHPDALALARDLLAGGAELPIAQLIIEERATADRDWLATADVPEDATWSTALDAIRGAQMGKSSAYRDWAELVTSPEIKALLIAAAAHAAEDEGDSETALDLSRQALELDSSHAESASRLIRLLRELGKWSELADRIADQAAESSEPDEEIAALHERAIVLEYALDDPSSADDALDDLAAREPEDVATALSQARLTFRAADWDAAVERLGYLAAQCPDDAPRLALLQGELLLLAMGRDAEAAEQFARAAEGLEGPLAQAARIYSIVCAYQRGEIEPLDEQLRQQLTEASDALRGLWLPEALETARAAHGAESVAETLSAGPASPMTRAFWQLMVNAESQETAAIAGSFGELADELPDKTFGSACRGAAIVLDNNHAARQAELREEDLESSEALWHIADRSLPDAEAEPLAELCEKRASQARERDPLEWADWLLCRAEAQLEAGAPTAAKATLTTALEELPEHPGLLEAQVELCLEIGEHEAAADICERLARLCPAGDQRAAQLARAALIALEDLDDEARAESLVREGLREAPGHEQANEVLTRILNARGDDKALAQQIEDRIEAEYDSESLVGLYQEQADRLLAVDDMKGALEAIENLLLLAPEDHGAHRTKIDIQLGNEDWQGTFQAMMEFIEVLDDPVEKRSVIWSCAELRATQLGEFDDALEMLNELIDQGDTHPQTTRHVAQIAKRGNRWEEAAQALERLADLVDGDKKLEALKELARIQLENLFEDEAAAETVARALQIEPADLALIEYASDFRDEEQTRESLERAERAIRQRLAETPVDRELITKLEDAAGQLDKEATAASCRAVIEILDGAEASTSPAEPAPTGHSDPDTMRKLIVHPDEIGSTAATVARICSAMTRNVQGKEGGFPDTGRSTLVGKRSKDPVRIWLKQWAELAGITEFDLHRVGDGSRRSFTLPGDPPAVAIAPELSTPLDGATRFYLARHLWRASQGLGAFEEGDAAGPVRWIIAVTMAVLGDDARPPLPTDRELVAKAQKALPRKIRKRLGDPCRALLDETPQSIRAWIQAASFSADRFGLLAAGDLGAVIEPLVEESAGPAGLKRLAEHSAEALSRVPRASQLVCYALSTELLELRKLIGLADKEAQ
jgi:hypothetical protein